MAVLLKRVLIYPSASNKGALEAGKEFFEVTDDERITVTVNIDNKSSGVDITLKNFNQEHLRNGEFRWKNEDTVKIFLKHTNDPTYEIDVDSTTDLVITAELEEWEAILDEKFNGFVLKCLDKTYLLLNKLWAKAYSRDEVHDVYGVSKTGWTPPEIIRDIIRITTAKGDGSTGVKADLESAGGKIADLRSDDSTFDASGLRDELSIAKVFKPVYEWIQDLSGTNRTNTSSELSSGLVDKRPYIFFIDEKNEANWIYPGTTSSNYEMTVGATATVGSDSIIHSILAHKMRKAVFDVINMIIYNAGDDYNGSGILDYFYDTATSSAKLKPVYKPMTNIAKEWKHKELLRGLNEAPVDYTLNNDTGTLLVEGRKYDATYNFKPEWANATGDAEVTSDATLNASLRAQCIIDGDIEAQRITSRRSNPRWRGAITLTGYKYQVGNLITFNDTDHGMIDVLLRITRVQHNISKEGFFSQLSVEEDPQEVTV